MKSIPCWEKKDKYGCKEMEIEIGQNVGEFALCILFPLHTEIRGSISNIERNHQNNEESRMGE